MKENTKEGFELTIDVSIEELEAKIAPEDNGETVLPLPKGAQTLGVNSKQHLKYCRLRRQRFPGADLQLCSFLPPPKP